MGTTENMARYAPGGYHPIIIGDIVRSPTSASSYRIFQKLGFGSHATVWFAQRPEAPQDYVAVKISTAQGKPTNEAKFLGSVNSPHIVTLIDAFDLEGPNGLHSVIVTEVVVPGSSFFAFPGRTVRSRKKFAYDLARGVADLHASGLVHGDLHLGNVGIALPQLARQLPEDVMQDFDYIRVTPVLPVDTQKAPRAFPAYVVTPCNMSKYYNIIIVEEEEGELEAKIFGFGGAHNAGENPTSFQCTLGACAPETVFTRTVEQLDNPPIEPPADVWALGATIYELIYGSSLFGCARMEGLLTKMSAMAAEPPSYWQERLHSHLPAHNTNGWWDDAERRERLTKNCSDREDVEVLIRMLRQIFVQDPSKRPSALEVCEDVWFKDVRSG